MALNCFSKYRCNVCKGKHHISLCNAENKSTNSEVKEQQVMQPEPQEATNLFTESKPSILLQTAQAEIFNPDNTGRKMVVRVVFDSGSQRSYITERVKDYLKLPVAAREKIYLKTFGQNKGKFETMDVTQLRVQDNWRPEEEKVATLVNTLVVPYICSPLQRQEIKMTQKAYPHLAGLQLADNPEFDAGSEVDILIGCDESSKFFTGEMRKGEENQGPIAMNTSLGWILSGPGVGVRSKQPGQGQAVATYLLKIDCLTTNEDQQLTKFWDFESIGIKDKETVPEAFEKNISFENGRYSVTLPFKENSPVLPDNYENILHCLDSTVKHLKKDPKVFEECDSIIKDQLEKGIIEPVDVTKPLKVGEVHYLPSQIVARQDALSTKIRIVFDASSKSNGICLNDTLHTGPSLTEQLYAVLMRFRAKKIGIIADVQKAFLAIGVDESQRDYLRFLWLANIADDNPEIVIYRFCSVVFGLCCSPFIMNATLQHHVKQYEQVDPQFVKLMLNSFYCDDLSLSVNSLEEAVSVCLKAKERYSHCNFFLRK